MYIVNVNNIMFLVNTMQPTFDQVAEETIRRASVVNGDRYLPIKMKKVHDENEFAFYKGKYRAEFHSFTLEVIKEIYKKANIAEESYIEGAILYANWHTCPWIDIDEGSTMDYFILNDEDFEQEEE